MYYQTVYNVYPLHISCFVIFQPNRMWYMIGILEVNCPHEKLRKNIQKKYQHQKTDRPIKHHMYSKIINKCKYQMAHKPSKHKTSCTKKNISAETQYLHTSKA